MYTEEVLAAYPNVTARRQMSYIFVSGTLHSPSERKIKIGDLLLS
jgi:hypothetical protein